LAHKTRTPLRPASKASLDFPDPTPSRDGGINNSGGGLLDTLNGLAEAQEAERFNALRAADAESPLETSGLWTAEQANDYIEPTPEVY